jgi:hypothetical protein
VTVLPSAEMAVSARLVREPIDVASLAGTTPADGALCLFVGVVRDENRGRVVLRLEYEAYEEMALPLMEEIAAETGRLHPVTDVPRPPPGPARDRRGERGGGYGSKTVGEVCAQLDIPIDGGLARLRAKGIEAMASSPMKDLAASHGQSPHDPVEILAGA